MRDDPAILLETCCACEYESNINDLAYATHSLHPFPQGHQLSEKYMTDFSYEAGSKSNICKLANNQFKL